MFCLVIIFSLAISSINTQRLKQDLVKYFKTDSCNYLRHEWSTHRQAMEHAIATAMKETTGKLAMNTFTMKPPEFELAKGYYHNHGQVKIVLLDVNLVELPQWMLPDISFSLSSNVIKVETGLSKMIIKADYIIMRNNSDVITLVQNQNPYKHSPFLFEAVQSIGKVAFSVEGCMLSGYAITRLNGATVNLGHHKFTLTKCHYTAEIYQPGSGSPPVITQYSPKKAANSLELKHLLLKPLQDEFIPKLEGALFSFVNTSAIFGPNINALEAQQTYVFRKTASNLTKIIRQLNKKIGESRNGAVNLSPFSITWDSSSFVPYDIAGLTPSPDEAEEKGTLKLSNMVLTGLDTAYISHKGGPYKLDTVFIGEQIRFNTLQVRGDVHYTHRDKFKFAVEMKDLAVNIDIDVENDNNHVNAEVVGFRKIDFSEPWVAFKAAEAIITGYLMDEVPKAIHSIIKIDIDSDHEKEFNFVLGELRPIELESSEEYVSDKDLPKSDGDVDSEDARKSSNNSRSVRTSNGALRKFQPAPTLLKPEKSHKGRKHSRSNNLISV